MNFMAVGPPVSFLCSGTSLGAEGLRFRVLRAQFATFRKDYGASVGICADIQGRVGFFRGLESILFSA